MRRLSSAEAAKQDEFYTQLADNENELKHYRQHFRGKVSRFWLNGREMFARVAIKRKGF